MFDFKTTIDESFITISLLGSLDLENANKLKAEMDNKLSSEFETVVFDLGGLNYIDSSGVAFFLYVKKILDIRFIPVIIDKANHNVYRVFELANIQNLFKFININPREELLNNISTEQIKSIFN